MTSAAQAEANRSNAQKSTGPRTPEGKAVAAQNAVRHGLLAKEVVVKGEDPGEFEFYRQQMLEELAPVGLMEEMLAQRIVGLSWRLRRAERLQAAAFDKIEDQHEPPEPPLPSEVASKMLAVLAESNWHPPAPATTASAGRRWAVQDFNQEWVLDRLLVYERRIERSLYRTMAELRLLRKEGRVSSGKWEEESACETNPICAGASSGKSEVSSVHPHLPEEVGRGRPTYQEPPGGGTTNGDGNESCETNPISGGVSSLNCEGASEQSRVAEAPGLPTSNCQLPTGDGLAGGVAANMPQAQKQSCETKPIREPGSAGGNPVTKPRKTPRLTNADGEWAYDSYLGRWVPLCAALTEEDLNRADARRSE